MIEVPAAITISGIFASVASGATANAVGVTPKPTTKLTFWLTINSCASRFVFSATAPSSLKMTSIFLPATVSPCRAMYRRMAAAICTPVDCCGPVIGNNAPILTVLCAGAPATVALNTAAARPAIAMLRSMMFSSRLSVPFVPSPACGGGSGRGQFSARTRYKSPLPTPPPQAGEGEEKSFDPKHAPRGAGR
jgi:hypothetical protein